MSEVTNTKRAGWARTALEAYVGETRYGSRAYDLTPDNSDNNEEVIGDFLSDLRHLCDELGLDFDRLSDTGNMHYRDEAEEQRQADELLAEEEAGEIRCRVCSEPIHRAAISRTWIHGHGSPSCGTGDGATALPPETEATMPATVEAIKDLLTPDPWGQAGGK